MTWHPLDSEFHQRRRSYEQARREIEERRRRNAELWNRRQSCECPSAVEFTRSCLLPLPASAAGSASA